MKVFYRRESVLYNIQTNSPKDLIRNHENVILLSEIDKLISSSKRTIFPVLEEGNKMQRFTNPRDIYHGKGALEVLK